MRLAIIACASLVLGGCHRQHGAPKPVPVVASDPAASASAPVVASAIASEASAPAALSPPANCAEWRTRLDATLHAAIAAVGDAGLEFDRNGKWTEAALKPAIDSAGLACMPFTRGMWFVEPGDDLDVHLDVELSSHETIHVSVDGHDLGPWKPDDPGLYVGYGGMPSTMAVALVGDYDGDGIPELWARTDEDGVESGHMTRNWILGVHDGKIGEYAPAKNFGDIAKPVDVDGDGRIDLPVTLGLALIKGQCDWKPYYAPADFLAHSLPGGGFSTTDAVARQHVTKWCPAMPATFKTREDALCARIRTKPADLASVRARIAASCVPWTCPDQKPQKPGANQLCNDMLDTFDQKTTFTL